jgi:hypothetical protein
MNETSRSKNITVNSKIETSSQNTSTTNEQNFNEKSIKINFDLDSFFDSIFDRF